MIADSFDNGRATGIANRETFAADTGGPGGVCAGVGVCAVPGSSARPSSTLDAMLAVSRLSVTLSSRTTSVSPGIAPSTQIGPVINAQQHARISSYADLGRQNARLRTQSFDQPAGGLFIDPQVFDQVKRDSELARDEIFGPLLSVIAVRDVEEAVAVALW